MTDEEKAEEWVKSQMVPCIQGQVSYFDFAIQSFLAGLKAGKDMVETDLARCRSGNCRGVNYD